ncbi:2-dehydropantoate 2-reductase [Novosphingobium sp.]|uniref:2-dehydropantoate 2-reductase n=1 Tax=Novosphingobium sp. TaxID=1874826 RepID=UPI002617299B|nr:2-dehydropantoate 2-reductase [Novosphingobium sp.]
MRIAIVGAGAIGTWLGARIAAAGHEVSVLARGETLAAVGRDGLRLDLGGERIAAPVRASDRAEDLGPQDAVLIAVKGNALIDLAGQLAPLIGPDTLIVPAMNGVPWWFMLGGWADLPPMPLRSVDPAGTIAAALPLPQVVGAVVHASVGSAGPGHAVHKAGNRLILGAPFGPAGPRLPALAETLAECGFTIERSDTIRQAIWYKLWGNMTMNPISAFTGATCDRILDDELVGGFVLAVMDEARAIGDRIGCAITERGEDRCAVTRQLGAFRTSMLQDVDAGRPLEIDLLLSAPREIAVALGIATPCLDALTGLTRLFARSRGLYPDA